jgi:hypothetical protein
MMPPATTVLIEGRVSSPLRRRARLGRPPVGNSPAFSPALERLQPVAPELDFHSARIPGSDRAVAPNRRSTACRAKGYPERASTALTLTQEFTSSTPEGQLRPDRTSCRKGSGLTHERSGPRSPTCSNGREEASASRSRDRAAARAAGLTAFSLPFAEPHAWAGAAIFINEHNASRF